MPKPLLLHRPSGLHVRFFVPAFLQPSLGRRYIVLSLRGQRADGARLRAAQIGYVLGQAYERMRGEPVADHKNLLETALAAARGPHVDLTIELPGGVRIVTDGSVRENAEARSLALELEGQRLGAPDRARAPEPEPKTNPEDLLSARIPAFLGHMDGQNRSKKNLLDTENTLALFLALVGDKPTQACTADDVDTFMAAMRVWPANASKKPEYRDLTPRAIVAKAKREGTPGLAPRTREKHLDRLRLFFGTWLKRKKVGFNPCDGFQVTSKAEDEAQTREPFSPADLRTIFSPDKILYALPHKYWTPILALYTGARVNELGQLHVEDVEEIAGIWGLHIRRKTKNRASRRFVPLHPELIRLGFLDYVNDVRAARFEHVFPGLTWGDNGPGDSIGDWFNRTYLRKTCGITSPAKVFHSFRHSFATAAERAGVADGRIAQLTGHSTGVSVLRKHYIHVAELPRRLEDISKVVFPEVQLTPRKPGFFEPYLRRQRAVEDRARRAEETKTR
ncbi:site-specific integrase [Luteibacter sp. ME-Dv--P-043b]|uniref:site-specific integrase n=1 Tax=Luteibacter sp. ME-Dv--P-043b TaxID=3040291 RepID=UPI0025559B9E|nr:site-specific integrase [Luteibacter sp. ME-Dv--P-043b]